MANIKETPAKKKKTGRISNRVHRKIVKQLLNPNVSKEQKDILMEKLYKGIEFK